MMSIPSEEKVVQALDQGRFAIYKLLSELGKRVLDDHELDRLTEDIANPGLRALQEMTEEITGKAAKPKTLTGRKEDNS